jgi:hypothetical protein
MVNRKWSIPIFLFSYFLFTFSLIKTNTELYLFAEAGFTDCKIRQIKLYKV